MTLIVDPDQTGYGNGNGYGAGYGYVNSDGNYQAP